MAYSSWLFRLLSGAVGSWGGPACVLGQNWSPAIKENFVALNDLLRTVEHTNLTDHP